MIYGQVIYEIVMFLQYQVKYYIYTGREIASTLFQKYSISKLFLDFSIKLHFWKMVV